MINVNDDFKIDIRTHGRQFDVQLKANNIDIDNDNLNYLKPAFNTTLFKTVMHQIEIDSKVYVPNKTKITGKIGVKVNKKTYNYIDLNTYYVKSCERQEDTNSYRILAYTKMQEAMVDNELELTAKLTVRNYLLAVCQKLNWNTDNIPESFINSNKLIDPTLHIGIKYTYRDILDEIATITCSFLLFKGDNLYLIYPTETNQNIDESYLDEDNITIGAKYIINSLVFSRAEESDNIFRKDDTSIAINGLHEYRISDCQLLSTNDRSDYIDAMFNYLKTLGFYIFDVQSKGILFLEACDIFNFVLNEVTYKTILLNNEIELDDGLTEKLYTDEPEETETEYKYADSTDKRIDKVYILVDKQNKRITQLTKETTENTQKITKVEQDVNGITSKVSSVEQSVENITKIEGTAEGKNIYIDDASAEPLIDIMLEGESQQGASPSPDNLSKIENLEGKNKFSGWVKGIAINATDGHQLANKTRASSDYIAVDFNQNPNYYLSGLANTLQTFVAVYNSNKEFLGRTAALLVSYFSLNSSSFIEGTSQGTGDIAYLRVTTYENTPSGTTGAIDDVDNLETQLEEGTVATNYVPYNSLEFKDEGENLFDCANSKIIYSNAITPYERLTNGLKIISSGEQYNMLYFLVNTVENLKGKTLTLSSDILFSKEKQYVDFGLYYTNFNGGNRKSFGIIKSIKTEGYYTIKGIVEEGENRDYVCIGLRPNMDSNFAKGDYTIYDNLQVEIGETATPYKPHQEQKVTFPLENQKLMEGSYLADDGIHHKRNQVVLDGSDDEGWTLLNSDKNTYKLSNFINGNGNDNSFNYPILSNYFKSDTQANVFEGVKNTIQALGGNVNGLYISFGKDSDINSVSLLRTFLKAKYDAGTPVIVEYELAEEEIVPYTETQQEAWEKLRHFTLFKGINNITSTANAKITYVRDNGLSDTYETKRNVKENYYTKSETDSQISQTADSIKESVKEINEQTQEKLATLELANQSLEFSTKRTGGNNLIRNSAMINDNNFWLAHAKYPYQESDIPPDNPAEGTYWYCTANSGSYMENQMYVYNSGWQVSELSRKSLLSAQNYFAYTTSNEYWASGKNANENTLSGRVIKLDGRQDYTVSHIFNITEPITLNQNENKMAISHFIKNSIVQGNVCVGLMFLNEADFTEVEKPYSLYEPGIILTPDDLKDLTKIEQIIEIPKKSDFIPVVVSNTAPTDTTKNWLDTTIYLPKKYNSQTSQWEILDTKMSLYNESSREVWTYRYFYGFYYQTPIIYDTAEIKSCYVALTFYPAFAVYTGNVEPTPYKGLYWNNKTTNLVKRAKYDGTTFVEWETLDIPSSLLPTGASLGVELFDYIVPIKGFVEIADLKLEYNTMCTQWTQFPGEVYGKNYKMDEKGFWIQANQNTMFIDEDEILATYKGINIFQINKDLAYFYKIQATESIEVGNYFLKTQQINSKNMLLLY